MKKNKTIKLNESTLNNIIKETICKVLREGTTNQEVDNMWSQAKEMMGAEAMIDALYNYLDCDTIADFVETLRRKYDMSFDGYNNEDEY